jgi:glycosyltransferase involved in cell wall biosynthesis
VVLTSFAGPRGADALSSSSGAHTFRPGFVVEQILGHITHSLNLKRVLDQEESCDPVWIDVPFRPDGLNYRLPPLSINWSLRGSYFARSMLNSPTAKGLDALFVHTLMIGMLGGSVFRKVPTVLSVDATPINLDEFASAYQHRRLPAPVEALKLHFTRQVLQEAKAYVAWSEWAKRSLVDDYGVQAERVAVITPGADLGLFNKSASPRQDGPVRILFVGNDFTRKGGDLLLECFRQRLQGRAELRIVSGSDEVQAAEGVSVHRGLTANSEPLLNLFETSDIFVLPTRSDCLALVLGEAMAASLPIITTSVGAHPEAVRHGENGLIVEPGSAEQLGAALETLVDNPGLRRTMGEAGRQAAEERFDCERNALQVLDLMKSIA